jgi:hypothetical protein
MERGYDCFSMAANLPDYEKLGSAVVFLTQEFLREFLRKA